MFVCVCNRVTDRAIREAVDRGIGSVDELADELRVATCCGRCRDFAQRILHEAVAARCPAEPQWACG